MTTWLYNIGSLETQNFPDLGLVNVVTNFTYTLQCQHENVYRNTNLLCVMPPPNPDSFVTYADLTESAVQTWAETYTNQEELANAKASLLSQCQMIKNQELNVTDSNEKTQLPPWATSGVT